MFGNKKHDGTSRRARRDLIFGPPPVLTHENFEAYELLLDRLYAEVKPKDFIEESLIHDAAHWTWNLLRLRRMRNCLIEARIARATVWVLTTPRHLQLRYIAEADKTPWEILNPPMPEADGRKLEKLATEAKKMVVDAMREKGLEPETELLPDIQLMTDTILTRAFLEELESIERLDRMIIAAENRRNLFYRELDRYRRSLGDALRAKIRNIEDAEFETVKLEKRRDKRLEKLRHDHCT